MNEDRGLKKDYKNHLFIANFENFDFEKLYNENKNEEYEGILWKNGGINKKGKEYKDLEIKINDTVYIFYNHLPDGISRILMKCSVIDTFDNNKECYYYKNETEKEEIENGKKDRIPAIRLKFQNAFCVEKDDKQREKFSIDKLKSEYGVQNFQGKQHLKDDLCDIKTGEFLQKKLIEDLEKTCESRKYKNYSLDRLKEYMNKISKCTLEGYKQGGLKEQKHQTFKKDNGMNYFEAHHLIEQCNAKGNNEFPKDIINDRVNIINLCANCHRMIHNGKKEDRKNMVTYLYNLNKEKYDELLSKIKEVKEGEEPLKWLLKQYDVED